MATMDMSTRAAEQAEVVSCNPDVVSGVPVFPGTRVPVRILEDWLEMDEPLNAFLDNFPSVTREQAIGVLEFAFKQTIGPRDASNLIR